LTLLVVQTSRAQYEEEGATALAHMCEPASLRTFMTCNVIWAFGLGPLAVIGFDTLKMGYLIASGHGLSTWKVKHLKKRISPN
jgi:hypothetical protein